MASRLAARATPLLMPEATPAWEAGAAPRAVAVSGATYTASPRPNTVTAGNTAVQYPEFASRPAIMASPAAETSGPSAMNTRGPRPCAQVPNLAASNSMTIVIGNSAEPAISGVNPD